MIKVIPFTNEYAEGVVSVILPIQQFEFEIPITREAQPDLEDIAGFYQCNDGSFWVALAGSNVVGTIGLLDIGNARGALRKMFVAATHRGPQHGVPRELLAALVSWCHSRGVGEVYLGSPAKFLAAHRFYEKNGFREIDRTELPESFPVMAVDTRFYYRPLMATSPRR